MFDLWRLGGQVVGLIHQGLSNLATEASLAAVLPSERIEDPEGGLVDLEGVLGNGLSFLLRQRQAPFQEGPPLFDSIGLGVRANEKRLQRGTLKGKRNRDLCKCINLDDASPPASTHP